MMNEARIAKMAEKIAAEGEDAPMELVDQALDMMIRSAQILSENLPKIEAESVPQKAAKDAAIEAMNEGVAPYLADVAKAMQSFD
jgi:hypothetical protein